MIRAWTSLFFFAAALHALAQQQPQMATTLPASLRVAVAGAPPFVMKKGDGFTGFSMDLWENIATRNGWKYEYRPFDTTEAALEAVAAGECDVLVGNTSITAEREQRVEFSQPFYRAGLQIMVSEQRGQLARLFSRIFEVQNLEVLGSVVALVLVATFAVAMFERRHNPDFPKTHTAGFAEAFYYVMGLLTGKSTYKGFPGVLGRLMLVAWMLASLFVVSYVTGVLASSMTVDSLRGQINGPEDLPDHTVGLVGGSQSENYAQEKSLDYVAYHDMDAAVNDLVKGKVQCLIGDAPILQYYDFRHPHLPLHEVGRIFQPVNYGFAVPPNRALRNPINLALLNLVEADELNILEKTYFGEPYQK